MRPFVDYVNSQHIEHIRLDVSLVRRALRKRPCLNRVDRYAVSCRKFGLRQAGHSADGGKIAILQQCPGVHKLSRIDVRETFEEFGAVGDEVKLAAADVELCYGHVLHLFAADDLDALDTLCANDKRSVGFAVRQRRDTAVKVVFACPQVCIGCDKDVAELAVKHSYCVRHLNDKVKPVGIVVVDLLRFDVTISYDGVSVVL